MKNLTIFIISIMLLVNLYGCIPLLAGAAGGAGTAAWLSGKLTQQVNASFDKTLSAVRSGLEVLKLKITKETIKDDVAQVMSNYTDGRTIWIDIRRISDLTSQIAVRVGAKPDKQAARKVLDSILRYVNYL